MTAPADLEIGLFRWNADSYVVELRYTHPESDTDVRLQRAGPAVQGSPPGAPEAGAPGAERTMAAFDLGRLRTIQEGAAYGEALSGGLFGDPPVRAMFAQARSIAQSVGAPLRVRLSIGAGAPELHELRWETLCDPQGLRPLATDERVYLSRYLSSLDWHPVRLRPRGDLSALVVIASPAGLGGSGPGQWALPALDVEGERLRAAAGLEGIATSFLVSPGRATLNGLIAGLRERPDVLYLVCHGVLARGEPYLFLEDEAGAVARVPGQELVDRLRELQERPRLVVLASCQSAGSGQEGRSDDGGVLAALGPRLAEVGIPAVLAMQGNVSVETVSRFMPVFFAELQRDGQIERAVAAARGAVRERLDWWVPALYTRLRSGRLWYVPGFADEQVSFEKWPVLLRRIQERRCTPIVGAGVLEPLIGSPREIARRWAEQYQFPMAPYERDRLPDVAQYLAVNAGEYDFPRRELGHYLHQELVRRHFGGVLPDDLRRATLEELLTVAWKRLCARNPDEPHAVLARLPFPVYISTTPNNLLAEALIGAGKRPEVEICYWNEELQPSPSVYDAEPGFVPSVERPLIYHLFGHLRQPESVVVAEDDFFDYLIGVTGNKDLIPPVVRRARTDSALLFLGFQLDDWDFRVLFRSIMGQEGRTRRKRYAHVAAQINPEEERILEPGRARKYLESYFEDADVSIYWGDAVEFLQEMWRRWSETAETAGREGAG